MRVALGLPEITASVLELMRSPTAPSCGLFGTGPPARWVCASTGALASAAISPRKRQIEFHGRKTGLPPPPMTQCPRAADYATQHTHTQNALRLTRDV